MKKNWTIKKHDYDKTVALAGEINVSPLLAALLIDRRHGDAESARRFLSPAFEHLHDPFLLYDIENAVDRIKKAVRDGEKVLIWGDYDVDGTTGTVLLRKVLGWLGAKTGYHIPNRFTEGYGLNIPELSNAKDEGYSLVITVDCGTRSFESVDWAKENGLDVIITDHHVSDAERGVPAALAVINPNRSECSYPDKDLAGVGVAFKLAHALLAGTDIENRLPELLEITAIGTIADMMRLTGENRAIVSLGLRSLIKTSNFGLKALMEVSDCTSEMTSLHIGFRIAPRINAAGRMDVASDVVRLLEADSFDAARRIAEILDSRNRERRRVQEQITSNALFEADDLSDKHFIVVSGDKWHRGVIGLAASRIAEKYHRPAIVLSVSDGIAHGSARSIPNFDIIDALDSCSDLFEQYGGHASAAGMMMKEDNIAELRTRLNRYAEAVFAQDPPVPELVIDALVTSTTLGLGVVNDLDAMEPFGIGNPRPVFITKGLILSREPAVMKEKHLKLHLTDNNGKSFEAIWWDGVERSIRQTFRRGDGITIAYVAEKNVWQGNERLQLVIQDASTDNL